MKNITLSVDENVLAIARRYAAEQNSSINQLVREFMTSIAQRHDRARSVRERLRQLSDQSEARIGTKSWNRNALHER